MVLATDALLHQIRLAGVVFRIRYYTETIGSVWDDERTITGSTSLYLSGIMEKIDATRGSEDEVLLEQGRIRYDDSKIFIAGSISTTSGTQVFTIAVSVLDRGYREITPGAIVPQYYGINVYKKLYVRELPNG